MILGTDLTTIPAKSLRGGGTIAPLGIRDPKNVFARYLEIKRGNPPFSERF
jgi:hypothetical protein